LYLGVIPEGEGSLSVLMKEMEVILKVVLNHQHLILFGKRLVISGSRKGGLQAHSTPKARKRAKEKKGLSRVLVLNPRLKATMNKWRKEAQTPFAPSLVVGRLLDQNHNLQ
jgi:hypothetical protein